MKRSTTLALRRVSRRQAPAWSCVSAQSSSERSAHTIRISDCSYWIIRAESVTVQIASAFRVSVNGNGTGTFVSTHSQARLRGTKAHTRACCTAVARSRSPSGAGTAQTRSATSCSPGGSSPFTDSTHRVDTGSTSIVVVNVAARRILLTIPGVGDFMDACVISFRDLTDLVVTDRGSVAWIVRKGVNCRTTTFEVHSAHASGAQSLLEEGPAIVPGSLRVSGQAASWESGGQRRSASLA
jgi:hypothetical protein